MLQLFQFICLGLGRIGSGGAGASGITGTVALVELTVFFVFVPDMLGNTPNAAAAKDLRVKTVIFQDLTWEIAFIIEMKKSFLKFPGEAEPDPGDAVDIGVLA